MKIEKLQPYGYCAGVLRAISLAKKAKEEHSNENVYVLGMLVHNKEVIDSLNKLGIMTTLSLDNVMDGSVVVLSAHGHKEAIYNQCKEKNIRIYDATCPKVQQNIELIKKTNKPIIYIGIKNHDEAVSAMSYSNNIFFYDVNANDFDLNQIKESPIVINQTTLNLNLLDEIHNKIKKHFPDAEIENEICNATRLRQQAIINSKNVDCFIIVGDKTSSNTNRLFEIAKNSHPNTYATIVSNVSEIDCKLLKNKKSIVIAGGASTPPSTIDAIFNYLRTINE